MSASACPRSTPRSSRSRAPPRRCTSAGSSTFDGARGRGSPSCATTSPERLARAPRYRQKLAPVPLGLHEPVWVDDPRLRSRRAPAARARARTSTRSSTGSSPRRCRATARCGRCGSPTSCPDDGVAMIGKMHHCMVDGAAVAELGRLILDAEPDAARAPAGAAWTRRRRRRRRARGFARGALDRAADGARLALAPARLATSPGRVRGLPGLARTMAHTLLPPAPGSPLNRPGAAAPPPRARVALARRPARAPAALRRHAQRRRARGLRGRAAALRRAPRRAAAAPEGRWCPPTSAAADDDAGARQPHLVRVPRAAVRRARPGRAAGGDPRGDRAARGATATPRTWTPRSACSR